MNSNRPLIVVKNKQYFIQLMFWQTLQYSWWFDGHEIWQFIDGKNECFSWNKRIKANVNFFKHCYSVLEMIRLVEPANWSWTNLKRLRVRRSNFMRSKLFFSWDRIHEVDFFPIFHEVEIPNNWFNLLITPFFMRSKLANNAF